MVILHIAKLNNNPFNGVCVTMPFRINNQKKYAEVGFVNVNNNVLIDKVENQIICDLPFDIEKLGKPFNKPDIVVFHEVYKVEYVKIFNQLDKKKIPYVIIPHGCLTKGAQGIKPLKKQLGNLLLFNRFIKNAKLIQCLSQREYDETDFGVKKFICPNGICIPEKRKKSFSEDGMKLLYVGRIDAHIKGLDILIDGINESADFMRTHNCTLEIRGPENSRDYNLIKGKIKEYAIEDIVFTNGKVLGKDKERKILDSDIFIQTSHSEGMPMGILEALSYGLPCIVSEGTGFGNFVNEKSIGWNTNDGIKNAIIKAYNDRNLWEKKSINAISFANKDFNWKKIAELELGNYKVIIRN